MVSVVRAFETAGGLIQRRLRRIWVGLRGRLAAEQAALVAGVPFEPFSFEQNGLPAACANVGWREVAQAFVEAAVVVVLHESGDLRFEIAWQEGVGSLPDFRPPSASP